MAASAKTVNMALKDYRSVVVQIQQATDIADLVGEHVRLARKGQEMIGLCPFHEDHRPSLCVNSSKQIFKCFACGAGGDVFKFLQLREGLGFQQAVERLAERAGIKIPTGRKDIGRHDNPNQLAGVNQWAAGYFHRNLLGGGRGRQALEYLSSRGISKTIVHDWKLGLAPASVDLLIGAAAKGSVSTDSLLRAGLLAPQGSSRYRNQFAGRLMFPIMDATGRVVGFGGRTLSTEQPKYVNSPSTILFDKSNSLYGIHLARQSMASCDVAVVVEGYTDCMMAHAAGFSNVVAALGTSLTAGQARILRRYAKQATIVFDSDIAGAEASNRALEICLGQGLDIKLASVPDGKDPCEFINRHGAKRFEQVLAEAVDVLEFKWARLLAGFNGGRTTADRKAAVEDFLGTMASALRAGRLSAVDRGLVVNRISTLLGIDARRINAQLQRQAASPGTRPGSGRPPLVNAEQSGERYHRLAQREILEVLLNAPVLFETAAGRLAPEVFTQPDLREIATLLFGMLAEGEDSFSLSGMLASIESVRTARLIVQLAEAGRVKGNFNARLSGAIEAIERRRSRLEIDRIRDMTDGEAMLKEIADHTGKPDRRNVGMI